MYLKIYRFNAKEVYLFVSSPLIDICQMIFVIQRFNMSYGNVILLFSKVVLRKQMQEMRVIKKQAPV